MEVCYVEVGKKDHEDLKYNREVKIEQKVDGKNKDNDKIYAKRMGFTWKHSNKRNNSYMDDSYIGFIHGVEVVVN
ncbi:35118_t:CDS:2, partial [Racocetra persica]